MSLIWCQRKWIIRKDFFWQQRKIKSKSFILQYYRYYIINWCTYIVHAKYYAYPKKTIQQCFVPSPTSFIFILICKLFLFDVKGEKQKGLMFNRVKISISLRGFSVSLEYKWYIIVLLTPPSKSSFSICPLSSHNSKLCHINQRNYTHVHTH